MAVTVLIEDKDGLCCDGAKAWAPDRRREQKIEVLMVQSL